MLVYDASSDEYIIARGLRGDEMTSSADHAACSNHAVQLAQILPNRSGCICVCVRTQEPETC